MLYRNSLTAPVFGLRREIDRLFEDTFGRDGNTWSPAVDIRESQNELRLDVEIPGMKPEDIDITAENGVLTIHGEKQAERKEEDESRYHLIERSYGSFTRSFQLPQGLDESRIEATCDNGMLSIHIPKSALPQPKKIQIKSGGEVGGQKQVNTGAQSGQRRMSTGSGNVGNQSDMGMAASGTSQSSAKNEGSRTNAGTRSRTAEAKS